MIYFVIYWVNIYVSKHKFISFEKNVWYFNDFGWFLCKFSMILADFWLIFGYPDPFHWSGTGSGSGWPKWNGSKRIRIRNNERNSRISDFVFIFLGAAAPLWFTFTKHYVLYVCKYVLPYCKSLYKLYRFIYKI